MASSIAMETISDRRSGVTKDDIAALRHRNETCPLSLTSMSGLILEQQIYGKAPRDGALALTPSTEASAFRLALANGMRSTRAWWRSQQRPCRSHNCQGTRPVAFLTRSPVASRLSASKASERHGPRYGMRGLDRRPCQEPATEKRFYRAAAPAR